MNKYVVGSILAVISLLVIFGASASNRVARWVDNPGGESASSADDSSLIGLNDSTGSQPSSDQTITAQISDAQTPLQRAGQFPQRQNFTDTAQTTTVTQVNRDNATTPAETLPEAAPTVEAQPAADPTPAPTVTNNNPQPVRALW